VKEKCNKGVFTSAIKDAKRTWLLIKLAIGFGILLWIEAIILITINFTIGFGD
jgi:hypothetical protein